MVRVWVFVSAVTLFSAVSLAQEQRTAWSVRLDEPTEFSSEDTPLRTVLEFFEKDLDVPVLVDESSLEEAGVTLEEPVKFRQATLRKRTLLKHLLGPHDLTFVEQPEALVVTTKEAAKQMLITRFYDVDELMSMIAEAHAKRPAPVAPQAPAVPPAPAKAPADGNAGGFPGPVAAPKPNGELVTLIAEHLRPDSWEENGGTGRISQVADVLVVTQTPEMQDEVAEFLAQFRAILAKRKAK